MADSLQQTIVYKQVPETNTSLEQYQGRIQLYKRVLIQLPIFMLKKDIKDGIQFNKLLLVNSQLLDISLEQNYKNINQRIQQHKWQDKQTKAYYVPENINNKPNSLQTLLKISRTQPQKIVIENSPDMLLKDIQKYKYLIDLDQKPPSSYKQLLILQSNSVLIKQQSNAVLWYHHLIKPNQHYISINNSLNNLIQQIDYLQSNQQQAKSISQSSRLVFKQYLSSAFIAKQLIKILNEYASIQSQTRGYFHTIIIKLFNITNYRDLEKVFRKTILTLINLSITFIIGSISYKFVRIYFDSRLFSHTHQKISISYLKKNNHIPIPQTDTTIQ